MAESTDSSNITDVRSKHAIDTAPLMAMACALIVNSHLEEFYPRAFLAADGLLGNSMFFLLSGFGLQLSEANQPRPFFSYYLRRILRLYPAILVCLLCDAFYAHTLFLGPSKLWYLQRFIWPTTYTFIRDIVPFYAVFYFFIRQNSARVYLVSIAAMVGVYLWFYLPDARQIAPDNHLSLGLRPIYISDAAYFQLMLLGGFLATQKKRIGQAGWMIGLGTLALVFLYLGLKYVMVVWARYSAFYGLLHLITFFLCGALLLCVTDRRIGTFYRSIAPVRLVVAFVAGLTLEIYLVHLCILARTQLYEYRFPLNILVFTFFTLVLSYILSVACRPVHRLFARKKAS